MKYLLLFFCVFSAIAQSNRLPPPGIEVPPHIRANLTAELNPLQASLKTIKLSDSNLQLLPDAAIYEKAVRYALEYNEFYTSNEFKIAANLLREGKRRLENLANGKADWLSKTGLVVLGYQSNID